MSLVFILWVCWKEKIWFTVLLQNSSRTDLGLALFKTSSSQHTQKKECNNEISWGHKIQRRCQYWFGILHKKNWGLEKKMGKTVLEGQVESLWLAFVPGRREVHPPGRWHSQLLYLELERCERPKHQKIERWTLKIWVNLDQTWMCSISQLLCIFKG